RIVDRIIEQNPKLQKLTFTPQSNAKCIEAVWKIMRSAQFASPHPHAHEILAGFKVAQNNPQKSIPPSSASAMHFSQLLSAERQMLLRTQSHIPQVQLTHRLLTFQAK